MKMNKINTIVLLVVFLSVGLTLPTQSQVTIGSIDPPKKGTILDLNSIIKGGLLLPNEDIPDLGKIPSSGFIGITTEEDTNEELVGTIVYDINESTGPGLIVWDGDNWIRLNTSGSLVLSEDPGNVNPFPYDGSKENFYTASDPSCHQTGTFSFTWIAGEEYIDRLAIQDAGEGKFSVKFQPNDRASSRYAIILITNPCGNSNTFVFIQNGDESGCGATTSVPEIKAENTFNLCGGGAAYLYLDGRPETGTYIWTLNGNEVGRGTNYIATQPGKYIVYGDKIGCPTPASKSAQVTASTTTAPDPARLIVNTNNGVACGSNGTTEIIIVAPPAGNIVWYRDGVKQNNSAYNNLSMINAGKGEWFAVVESNECSSIASESAFVIEDNSGGSIPTPILKINGQTSGWRLCSLGSAYLEIANFDPQYLYTWYADNTQIGTGTGIYYPVPSATNVVIRARATGSGCASESNTYETISQTPAPSIPLINGSPAMCGGSTTLSVGTTVGSPVVAWYKDGSLIQGETGVNITTTQPGDYSATVSDNGCLSPMSVAKTVYFSNFTRLSWIQEPEDAYFGDQKIIEATGTNGPVTYSWSIKHGGVDAPSLILAGQGTNLISVHYPANGSDVSDQIEITVRGTNECGQDINVPSLSKSITLSNSCPTPVITNPTATQNMQAIVGNSITLSVTAANINNPSYIWYNSADQAVGTNSSNFTYTPTSAGTEIYYCKVSNGCGTDFTANSPSFIVNIIDPVNALLGAGNLTGRVCFDIVASNFGTGGCGTQDSRTLNKADFTTLATSEKTYIFTALATGTSFNFVVDDQEKVLDETNPYTVTKDLTGDFSSGSVATIVLNYKTNLNSPSANPRIVGRTSAQAAKVILYAMWKVGSTDYKVSLEIKIQDCICCGAKVSPTEWKTFMCHNLGADESLPPFAPAPGLNGSYYQFGRKNAAATANDNPNNMPSGWNSSEAAVDAWNDNMKTENDPCPAGYRLPTKAEWDGLLKYNTISATGSWANDGNYTTGIFVGNALYLPAAGFRSSTDGHLLYRGNIAAYWSSTYWGSTQNLANDNSAYAMRVLPVNGNFNNTSSGRVEPIYFRTGHSVRCVAQ